MDYKDKNSDYYSNVRLDLIDFADFNKNNLKILEVGSAYCETLNYLKEKGTASITIGIDLFEDVKGKDKYKPVDKMIFGNIEELDLPEYNDYFDVIILADVLEHIYEPNKTLDKIKKWLNKDGYILVSMPNIQHYSAFNKIFLRGSFKYEESGLFDYTHVRFYCKKDIKNLLEKSNFKVINQDVSFKHIKGMTKAKIANILTLGLFKNYLSYQYFFKANKL
ncbi:class I SAM-dependent methyltransferase [Flavobacterium gelidilacus]|jgi:2-polyprenyl-3-methyl-5-hydroxy-6-metoxy-1,4-benzoquinol methylase|uniref:class I SAM-dependent methyltransferase n=1 Tax=Flavobacterium gelidilacus TaxID=206041 RepID=UPI00041F6AED|nr:class I SAM-dependent methyltransferase [Flavobacterium gelidilacus]